MVLGLSDHTPGHSTVLGAVALGARVIEKHFTLDNHLKGPDHAFSMNPKTWSEMVRCTRELENALGSGVKKVEENEKETVVVQRRSLCFQHDMEAGQVIHKEDLACLRPAVVGAVLPYEVEKIVGCRLSAAGKLGEAVFWNKLEDVK
jgi:N-acetylneuraminate synthase